MDATQQSGPRPTEAVPEDDCIIRFRLSDLDSVMIQDYEAQPFDTRTSPFVERGTKLSTVPVIRIFGATDHGQRVVAHIHGVFSYLFVEYKGSALDPNTRKLTVHQDSFAVLGMSLNQALELSQRKSGAQQQRRHKSPPQHVAFIVPVKAIPIYGYHIGYKPFLKIYITNPRHKTRTSELLRSGAVMGTKFDVFESHVPYHLQFMLDANLYGCGWVEVSNEARFRTPLPKEAPPSSFYFGRPSITGPFGTRIYTEDSVPTELCHPAYGPDKSSHCPIEIDLHASAIVNRRRLHPRNIHHDFVELLKPETVEVDKLVKSLKELWDDEQRRRAARGDPGPHDIIDNEPREWDKRELNEPHWELEAMLRAKVEALASKSKIEFHTKVRARQDPAFETYVDNIQRAQGVEIGYLHQLRTSFESYDALFPSRMAHDERTANPYGVWAVRGIGIDTRGNVDRSESGKVRRSASVDIKIDFDAIGQTQAAFDKVDSPDFDDAENELLDERGRHADPDEDFGFEADLDAENMVEEEILDEQQPKQEDSHVQNERLAMTGSLSPTPTASASSVEQGALSEPPTKRSKRVHLVDVSMPESFQRPAPDLKTNGHGNRGAQVTLLNATAEGGDQQTTPTARRFAPRNPFASPDKTVTVRRATQSMVPQSREPSTSDDEMPLLTFREDGMTSPEPADGPPLPQQPPPVAALEDEVAELEELPSSAFDEYRPTPTLQATQHDSVPDNLRSTVGEEVISQPILSNRSSSTSVSDLHPQYMSSNERPSASSLPKSSPRKTVTFKVDETSLSRQSSAIAEGLGSMLPPLRSTISSESVPHTTTTDSDSTMIKPDEPQRTYPLSDNAYIWSVKAPTTFEILSTLEHFDQPRVMYQDPFYSLSSDISKATMSKSKSTIIREYGGRKFTLMDATIRNLEPFRHHSLHADQHFGFKPRRSRDVFEWQYAERPPSLKDMRKWINANIDINGPSELEQQQHKMRMRQIEGPTQKNSRYHVQAVQGSTSQREPQHMSILALELHVNTRGKLLPDPKEDPIEVIFYCLKCEDTRVEKNGRSEDTHVGAIAVGSPNLRRVVGSTDFVLDIVETELELVELFLQKLVEEWDPEAVAGYEVHKASWGYMLERVATEYNRHLVPELGRVTDHDTGRHGTAKSDRWGFNQASTLNFTGRHVLPIWRILKADNHLQYNNFEHVVFQVLKRRYAVLGTPLPWYTAQNRPQKVAQVFAYWRDRVEMDLEMLDAVEFVEQTCESARVFGVDFRSVRTRGSQFKVESVMFKLSKPESFMMLSPSRPDVGRQNAAECQPLIMEPQSAFYKGPLVVLDFQSLYPSVMIAYNFCFSTCLGRIEPFKGTTKFGTSNLEHPPGLVHLLKDDVNITPNGMMFVKPHVRKSLVAKMLTELLDTRVMVKSSMKMVDKDKSLLKLMNARQLALKYLANVTYGYIGATFSGRMPCVEIADAIVQSGRETLEKALRTIHSKTEWGARVVYGDTDSLFIYLPGKSKEDAFRIGNEMADYITSQNPRPIKLKFEKVYLPCVLLAKKRYTGYKYEKLDDPPEVEAKGIEIIRRDGIPALQKMEDQCLRILFTTSDLSQVKAYCQRQWAKLLANKVSPQDFVIAKAVKLGTYAEDRLPPPGAAVAARMMHSDPRGEPEYGERVPYILYQAEPGTPQVDRAVSPQEFLADPRMRLDATHYIEAMMLKPLARIFDLMGADVWSWWRELPKQKIVVKPKGPDGAAKVLLDEHFVTDRCAVCKGPEGQGGLCESCRKDAGGTAYKALAKLRDVEQRRQALRQICKSCSAQHDGEDIACDSVDCSVRWDRAAVEIEREDAVNLVRLIS
ncbi:DNA polymerase zeta [Microbotryomycetes sp. JL221]|nr:DNA polymerase zeta [Microbotryomycetes sp. JL221]